MSDHNLEYGSVHKSPDLSEMVRVISGRTLHQKQLNVLNHPMCEPVDGRIYLFIDPVEDNVKECNKVIQNLYQKAGLGSVPFPFFSYRGVCMLVMPEGDLWDYPLAIFAHLMVTNVDKLIAIRGVHYLTKRLSARKSKNVLPSHYQCLSTLNYNAAREMILHKRDEHEPDDYDVALRKWKPVDLKHPELKDLLKKYIQLV